MKLKMAMEEMGILLVEAAKAAGQTSLPPEAIQAFEARYQAILDEGFDANPKLAPPPESAKRRGRVKQSPARNLLNRLQAHADSVLGFMRDFSGSFRSSDGAMMFARIRGYLSTMRKQERNVLEALIDLFSRKPQSLQPQPE